MPLAAGVALLAACQAFPTCLPLPGTQTALFLEDVLAGDGPSEAKRRYPGPAQDAIGFTVDGRRHAADLYRSSGGVQAGLVLTPGAAPAGRRHPQLTAFARSLARAGFAVLVPDVPTLEALAVSPGDVRIFADAVRFLASRPDLAPGGRVGIATFSYSVGPAVLAALQPETREVVDFILGVGGYHDLQAELVFATTGYYRVGPEGPWRYRKPSPYALLVFVLGNLEHVPEADRDILRRMAERRVADPAADLGALAAGLGPQGRALYEFVANTDLQRAHELLRRLPDPVRADIAALDLANKDLSALRARLILVHGQDDDIVPYTESLALARAVPGARAFLLGGFAHVETRPGVLDAWTMYCAIDALLGERGR